MVRLDEFKKSDADGVGSPLSGDRTLTFRPSDPQLSAGLVPHLFGLAIGFGKENDRADWPSSWPSRCGASQTLVPGNSFGTAPDLGSVMATTGQDAGGNCTYGSPTLSNYDAMAANSAYGPRHWGFVPLATWWDGPATDHRTVDPRHGLSGPSAYFEGWTFSATGMHSGTVQLRHYRKDDDHVTVAAGSPTEELILSAFYELDGVIGAIFPTEQPGTVPLRQYWHPLRHDYFATASGPGMWAAIMAGYEYKGIEGYVFPDVPYTMLGGWWSQSREDNLTTAVDSPLAAAADGAGYSYFGFDSPVYKYPIAGTIPLDNYWSNARQDHFLLANPASRAAAEYGNLYTYVRTEGYVMTSGGSPSGRSLVSYWSSSRAEHFSAARPAFRQSATDGGYSMVRGEGYALDPVYPNL